MFGFTVRLALTVEVQTNSLHGSASFDGLEISFVDCPLPFFISRLCEEVTPAISIVKMLHMTRCAIRLSRFDEGSSGGFFHVARVTNGASLPGCLAVEFPRVFFVAA